MRSRPSRGAVRRTTLLGILSPIETRLAAALLRRGCLSSLRVLTDALEKDPVPVSVEIGTVGVAARALWKAGLLEEVRDPRTPRGTPALHYRATPALRDRLDKTVRWLELLLAAAKRSKENQW